MKGYEDDIGKLTLENTDFRRVLYTAKFSQLVLMSLVPGEEIGMEVHDGDQFLRFESGEGKAIIDGVEYPLTSGSAVLVPAGTEHNIVNTSETAPLQLYTVYAPPHHRDQVVHQTKAEAIKDDEHFAGKTSE